MISYIILGILIFSIGFGLMKRTVHELRLCESAAIALIALVILLNLIPPLIIGEIYIYFASIPIAFTGLYFWLSTKNPKLILLDFLAVAVLSGCLIIYETYMPTKNFEYLHLFIFVLIAAAGGFLFSSSFRGAVAVSYLSALIGSVYYFYASDSVYVLGGAAQLDLTVLSFVCSALLFKIFNYFSYAKIKTRKVEKFEAGEIFGIDEYENREREKKQNTLKKRKKDRI